MNPGNSLTTNARILVIDDDPAICLLMRKLLSRRGYDVVATADAQHGLALLEREPIDLLITDVVMPDADGFEILQSVQKKHPSLPVMVISGGNQLDAEYYLRVAKTLRAAKTLRKPFRADEIYGAVAELLSGVSIHE